MWTVVVLVLALVAAGMLLFCVLQLACRPGPVEEVRFDPGEEPAPPEPQPADEGRLFCPGPSGLKPHNLNE